MGQQMNWEKAASRDKARGQRPETHTPMTSRQRNFLTELLGGEPPDYSIREASDVIDKLIRKRDRKTAKRRAAK